jgi:hypothetical protein
MFVLSGKGKYYKVNKTHVNHARLRSMNKDWLAQNQDNVSGWSDISTPELLF